MAAKKMPNYEQILNQLGLSETFYSASQRMSSHFVHCSYTSLFNDIISHDNNRNLSLKQYIESLPHVNNYSPMIYIIINTTNEFFNFVFDENEVDVFNQWMSKVKEKLESHKSYLHGDDFSAV